MAAVDGLVSINEVLTNRLSDAVSESVRESVFSAAACLAQNKIELLVQVQSGDVQRVDVEQWCALAVPPIPTHIIAILESALNVKFGRGKGTAPPSAVLAQRKTGNADNVLAGSSAKMQAGLGAPRSRTHCSRTAHCS